MKGFLPLCIAAHAAAALLPQVLGHGGSSDSGDSSDHVDLRAKSLIVVKILCLIITFVSTFVAGISPYFFKWSDAFLILGTHFAGGVFLCTALLHFLGDSNGSFEELTTKTYPFAYMLCAFGYLLTYLADVVIASVYNRHGANAPEPALGKGEPTKSVETEAADEAQCECTEVPNADDRGFINTSILLRKTSFGDSLLLILALCFHSVFEGIAIGISATKYDAWRNMWTISLHKIFAAIAMGIALLRIFPTRPLTSCVAYAFAFAISTPIGIAIGIIINATTQGNTATWIEAITMGIASGVFIYVAINHLLGKGFGCETPNRFQNPFMKFVAATLGVGVIAVVLIWD